MEFRLSDDAQTDTVEIYSGGVVRWGANRAEAYYNGIYDAFIDIAEYPLAIANDRKLVLASAYIYTKAT